MEYINNLWKFGYTTNLDFFVVKFPFRISAVQSLTKTNTFIYTRNRQQFCQIVHCFVKRTIWLSGRYVFTGSTVPHDVVAIVGWMYYTHPDTPYPAVQPCTANRAGWVASRQPAVARPTIRFHLRRPRSTARSSRRLRSTG